MINITEHGLHIDEAVISDLRQRLQRTRWPEQLPGVDGWAKGMPVDAAREWAERWADFDWPARQRRLNDVPQFLAEIDGHRLHFAHVRSDHEDAIGLLLLHGWPDAPFELFDLIRHLTEPGPHQQAFHVVLPSHPGMGVPGPTTEPWDVERTARAYTALMSELGHDQYFVQGGDHGAVLGPHVARIDPDHVRGVHVNAATLGFMPMETVDDKTRANLTPIEQRRLDLGDPHGHLGSRQCLRRLWRTVRRPDESLRRLTNPDRRAARANRPVDPPVG
ncbi:epoxide hydrolase family protein [Propionibacteriaceae bacterium Y1700]|uniref:epoxide hydrolase family protein n=1 Tax=Microlunatus sp. Y1700 TaxID=3418487 RepID=UPI003DA7822A